MKGAKTARSRSRLTFDGAAFRKAREGQGLSTTQLAAAIGASSNTIEGWERGGTPHSALLMAACGILGLEFVDLWKPAA